MNTLKETFERQGQWFKDAVELLGDHNPLEALPCLYSLDIIDQYVFEAKVKLKYEIKEALKKEYVYKETGEDVLIDKDFLGNYLGYYWEPRVLISQMEKGKLSTVNLIEIHKKMVLEPEFTAK
jgi:hypothetical protein